MKHTCLAALVAVCFLTGCEGETKVWVDFSPPDETLLSELTQEQLDTMTQEMEDGFRQVISLRDLCMEFALTISVLSGNTDPETCYGDFAQCKDEESLEYNVPEKSRFRTWWFNNCTGTVADLEVCVNDSLTEMARAYDQLKCEGTAEDLDKVNNPEEPHSCTLLEESCGNYTGNTTSTTDMPPDW